MGMWICSTIFGNRRSGEKDEREKLRISRIPHSQSSGIAREACALKGERCVFYEMDINPHVDSVERDGVGIFHIFLHTCCP